MKDLDNDRDSGASSDEHREQEEAMATADADEMDVEESGAPNREGEGPKTKGDGEGDGAQDKGKEAADGVAGTDADDPTTRVEAGPSSADGDKQSAPTNSMYPRVRPEALKARLYDIVPTMAAPQSTSINAIAITPNLRYWMTGGSDGYVRKYDGPGTINGKQLLTVAQRHPFVDSVVKAGILMSYWENFEPAPPEKGRSGAGDEDRTLSPVYSLAVHRDALWSLSGLESGGINIHSVRYDEGKVIHAIPAKNGDHLGHSNAVSVLQLTPDETHVLSGSWDKRLYDWDLNTGTVVSSFEGSGGQVSAIELRPQSGAPIPAEAAQEPSWGDTMRGSSRNKGFFDDGTNGTVNGSGSATGADGAGDGEGTVGSDHESLFGSPGGSLFGDGQMGQGGGNAFGGDDDNEFQQAMLEPLEGEQGNAGDDAAADTTMTDAPPADEAPPLAQLRDADATAKETVPGQPPSSDANGRPRTADSGRASSSPQQQQQQSPQSTKDRRRSSQVKPPKPTSPTLVFNPPPPLQHEPSQTAQSTFMAASIDGAIRIWDRRMVTPVARIGTRPGVPPWCMGVCWSPDGNMIYAGRRNGTVEEFSIHHARGGYPGWQPERSLKFPAGSGAVSAVRHMPNGRHLVCASHDILRLYDLHGPTTGSKHGSVPFLIIPGPPRAGVISQLYVDPSARFMITAAGTRGWEGSSTEVLIGYEIGCTK